MQKKNDSLERQATLCKAYPLGTPRCFNGSNNLIG
nr:MAG TPA: hypothetical protein [Caudoviricetes sp.]